VFLDIDNDGARDSEELGLDSVRLRVGGRRVATDRAGRFSVSEMLPFEAILIQVDTTSLENPFYVVPNRVVEVTLTPNSFVPVDIPVVMGAEVTGGVLFEGEPLAGARITLRELETGRRISLITFSDGGFYTIGLLPGTYEVTISRTVLESLGAVAPPVRFVVPPGPGEKVVDAVVLTVEREEDQDDQSDQSDRVDRKKQEDRGQKSP